MPLRFEARFSNGAWRVFDTQNYTTAYLVGREVDAVEEAARENAFELTRKASRK